MERFWASMSIWIGLLLFVAIFRFCVDLYDKEKGVKMKDFLYQYYDRYKENTFWIIFYGTIVSLITLL